MKNLIGTDRFIRVSISAIPEHRFSLLRSTDYLANANDQAASKERLFDMQIWTVTEVALALDCSIGTIYNKVSQDEIPFHQKGKRGRLYFIPSEILEWIKEETFI